MPFHWQLRRSHFGYLLFVDDHVNMILPVTSKKKSSPWCPHMQSCLVSRDVFIVSLAHPIASISSNCLHSHSAALVTFRAALSCHASTSPSMASPEQNLWLDDTVPAGEGGKRNRARKCQNQTLLLHVVLRWVHIGAVMKKGKIHNFEGAGPSKTWISHMQGFCANLPLPVPPTELLLVVSLSLVLSWFMTCSTTNNE